MDIKRLTMIIGTGGAGNQNAFKASKTGFPAIAVNSTAKDMTEIMESDTCYTILLSEDGCGKDRDIAKEILKTNYKDLLSSIDKIIDQTETENVKVVRIVVVAAINSGTGAGQLPLTCDLLQMTYKNKKKPMEIIAAPIFPDDVSVRSLTNALETMKELIQLNIPYLPIDNMECEITSPKEKYEKLNEVLLQKLTVIRGDYFKYSPMGNIDEKDKSKLLTVPGMIKIGFASKLKNNLSSDIEEVLINAIENDLGVRMQPDKIVKKMGIVLNLTEEMLNSLDRTYPKLRQYFGTLIDVFENITIADDEKDSYVVIILSGLSDPDYRLTHMKELIEEQKESLVKAHAIKSSATEINESVNWFKEMEKDKEEDESVDNLEDIFGKY